MKSFAHWLPVAPVGTIMGLPQMARLALVAAHTGPAVLLTTRERLPLYAGMTDTWGRALSMNPTLQNWDSREEVVLLDVESAIELFPSQPSNYVLSLQIGQQYPREALLDRIEALGYPFEDAWHIQGDRLTLRLGEQTLYADFFGDELDTLKLDGQSVQHYPLPPAEGFLPPERWDSSRLQQLNGRVFLDVPESYSAALELHSQQLWQQLRNRDITAFGRTPLDHLPDVQLPIQSVPFYRARLSHFAADLERYLAQDYAVIFVQRHQRTGEYLEQQLWSQLKTKKTRPAYPIAGTISLAVGHGEGGFVVPESKVVVLSEDALYGFQGGSSLRGRRLTGKPVSDALGLQINDFLIHPEYGIGQFLGIETREVLGVKRDYLHLNYAKEAKIHVPIELLPLLRRHPGTTDDPPSLSGLGKNEWTRAREKARANAEALAARLLVQYAARQVLPGTAYPAMPDWDNLIADNFKFTLTKDQKTALRDVYADLEKSSPMERLIAGDVGFGKTEVALRAAHRVVGHGKQVVVLVPTTLLAEQHTSTFVERFKGLPVRVEGLSRFTSPQASLEIVRALKAGQVDIIIGTHRLLSRDIQFKQLGLIIIDEEHRFGVVQKEKLRLLSVLGSLDNLDNLPEASEPETAEPAGPRRRGSKVPKASKAKTPSLKDQMQQLEHQQTLDVLSLSATPIPRTLYMSMVGLRDLSSIQSPPIGRKPIKTILSTFDPFTVRSAIMQELERGGKVFYIHDRVASIGQRSLYLRQLVPEARIAVAHGQMHEEELEEIMLGFEAGAFDVLLATTIVETGLDIPEANTILIERADRLGLAQLYQLRGRVGRRNLEAYAYLFHPPKLNHNASRRLWAISDLQDLGTGHRLAEKDMEIRGVGNMLGQEQHGHIQAVSIEVYTELLAEAVAKLKGESTESPNSISIDLPVHARLAPEYFGEESARIEAYGRISEAKTLPALSRIEKEWRIRYGVPSLEVQHFLDLAKLRILALAKRVISIQDTLTSLNITFGYANLDYDAAALRRYTHKTEILTYPPSLRLEKRGLFPDDYPKVLIDVLGYFA